MNFSISGLGPGFNTANTNPYKMVGASDVANKNSQNKNGDKKDNKTDTAAVLSITNSQFYDRSKEITARYQSMRENIQKQIDSLNERLKKATEIGDSELEKELTENIKGLTSDFSALDEQMNASLFEEQQRKAAEAKKKDEDALKKRETEQEKFKTDEEQIKKDDEKTFKFFTKADQAKGSIQNSKIQKAVLERTKGRLEGEMAADGAAKADREQLQQARMSELRNGFSRVPYVSDKTMLTELKRIASGSFTAEEGTKINELNKLNSGIANTENHILSTIAELNESSKERAKSADNTTKPPKNNQTDQDDSEQADENDTDKTDADDTFNDSTLQ